MPVWDTDCCTVKSLEHKCTKNIRVNHDTDDIEQRVKLKFNNYNINNNNNNEIKINRHVKNLSKTKITS